MISNFPMGASTDSTAPFNAVDEVTWCDLCEQPCDQATSKLVTDGPVTDRICSECVKLLETCQQQAVDELRGVVAVCR